MLFCDDNVAIVNDKSEYEAASTIPSDVFFFIFLRFLLTNIANMHYISLLYVSACFSVLGRSVCLGLAGWPYAVAAQWYSFPGHLSLVLQESPFCGLCVPSYYS